jgi:diguanylate cyclase
LGAWVLFRACSQAAQWAAPEGGAAAPAVAINVSILQLREPRFVRLVSEVLLKTGVPPERLVIEVTESVFEPAHAERMGEVLGALSSMGVGIHVDDFGSGYSSLSRLQAFPINAIKIDRSFIASLETGANVIVEAAILIAHRFGIETVAEGVETMAQARELSRLGVDAFQGYLLARPHAEAKLESMPTDWLLPYMQVAPEHIQ